MAQVFISYSRVDAEFTGRIVERLRRVYGLPNVWYDDELHGGQRWWKTILEQIDACDVFVYLLSNESVTSPYCQAEFAEALRLRKPVVTVQIRDKTRLSGELSEIQYVDMKRGLNDENLVRLIRAINELAALPQKRRPLSKNPTPLPSIPEGEGDDGATREDVETPTLVFRSSDKDRDPPIASVIIGVLVIIGAIASVMVIYLNSVPPVSPTSDATAAFVANLPSPILTETPAPTLTPTTAPSATDDLGATQAAAFQATLTALADLQTQGAQTATADAATRVAANDLEATLRAVADTATVNAIAITLAVLGETATRQSVEATRTRDAEIANITATANAWTDTPTPTPTPTPTLTPDPLQAALAAARAFSGGNAAWRALYPDGFTHAFADGVPMVLVPVGCFMMGSAEGQDDERPVHQQCFDEPYWIDVTEVTQADFERLGGTKANANRFDGDRRPVESITWFEARDFCARRGARLPTEREWEYAARGPDGLVYPWGNAWNPDNAVFGGNSNRQTATVGSRPAGASWVGALDLSGNVWEWVSTIYGIDDGDYNFTEAGERRYNYPYQADDGRERDSDDRTFVRVLRGGSWITVNTDYLRAADRLRYPPVNGLNSRGFRCARSF